MKEEAAAVDGEIVIITFHPHPRKVVSSVFTGVRLINTLEEKLDILSELGSIMWLSCRLLMHLQTSQRRTILRIFWSTNSSPYNHYGYDHRLEKNAKVITCCSKKKPQYIIIK
jgi:riboflavin kinase/FMN adenylyltransferase